MMRDHDCPDLLYRFTKQNFSQYIADVLMRNTPIRLEVFSPRRQRHRKMTHLEANFLHW